MRVLIVDDDVTAERIAAVRVVLSLMPCGGVDESEAVEYVMHKHHGIEMTKLKPHKTYLNLAKKDRWQK